jgi:capsular polysaccharide biosynthesis protein
MFLYSMRPYVIIVGFVRVPGVPVLMKSGHRVYDQNLPGQELQAHARTHTHTSDDNDIRPHTVQEHNERTVHPRNLT